MKSLMIAKPGFAFWCGFCLIILALAAACRVEYYPTPEPSLQETVTAQLQDILDAWRSRHGIVGVTIAVDGPKIGAIQVASGISNQATGAAMVLQDRFAVAGLTKTFTAALVLQLVHEGSLSLDDHLHRWFPQFRNSQEITVRQLLNHTSGVAEYLGPVFYSSVAPRLPSNRLYTPQELIDFASTEPPSGPPGEGWSYSNTNYVMLGRIAETVTGNPLKDELRNRFFKPFQLPDTFLMGVEAVPSVVYGYTGQYAQIFIDTETGTETGFEMDLATTTLLASTQWAAGGMASTAGDMTSWAKALYGGRVITQPLLEQMVKPSPLAADFAEGLPMDLGAGMGTFLYTTSIGPATGHWGREPGFSALMLYVPGHDIAVTALTNDDRAQVIRLPSPDPQDLAPLVDQVLLAVWEQIQGS